MHTAHEPKNLAFLQRRGHCGTGHKQSSLSANIATDSKFIGATGALSGSHPLRAAWTKMTVPNVPRRSSYPLG
jgi:hypothetical protein